MKERIFGLLKKYKKNQKILALLKKILYTL